MPLGESIDLTVIRQIEARQELFSTNNRNEDQLRYLNSRNAWVRVISFVNKNGSAKLSENFVLSGVASSHTDDEGFKQYSGVDFTLESDSPTSDSNSFYKTTEVFGTRPRPGITSFNIKSKNSGGTIQVAEIGFVVWNEDDLDTIEQLYLRLGFEVMVEWGHTVYIDNDGDLQPYVDGDYKTFFDNTVFERTVKRHIKTNREKTNYNADGFLGYITNFSWSFRQDGGYECSIKVISTGAVIESLLGSAGSSEKSQFLIEDCYISDFHSLYRLGQSLTRKESSVNNETFFTSSIEPLNFTDEIKEEAVDGFSQPTYKKLSELGAGGSLLTELSFEFNRYHILNTSVPFGVAAITTITRVTDEQDYPITEGHGSSPVFLPLRYCLAVINGIIKRLNREKTVLFDVKSDEKFLKSDNLIVIKPLKTLLLTQPTLGNPLLGTTQNLYYERIYNEAVNVKHSSSPLEENEILNIFVNLEVFVRNIDSLRESTTDSRKIELLTLLTNVLEEINESVSYGIDLGITFDEDTGKFKIIDKGNLPGPSNPSTPREIKISGTSTTVSSLSLTSKVTNKLGNQISIAAQTDPGSYPASVIKYREWNQDLTSRLKRINREAGITPAEGDAGIVTYDQRAFYFSKLFEQYRILNTYNWYYPDEWKILSTNSQTITQEGIDNDPEIPKGLIPIELSFTMDGIAGLKVLQSFKIPDDLLPKKYDSRYVGFIINGLEHTIENNRWFTKVTAQMFIIRGKIPNTEGFYDDLYRTSYLFSSIPSSYFRRSSRDYSFLSTVDPNSLQRASTPSSEESN